MRMQPTSEAEAPETCTNCGEPLNEDDRRDTTDGPACSRTCAYEMTGEE